MILTFYGFILQFFFVIFVIFFAKNCRGYKKVLILHDFTQILVKYVIFGTVYQKSFGQKICFFCNSLSSESAVPHEFFLMNFHMKMTSFHGLH